MTDVKNCEDGPNCLLSTDTHRVISKNNAMAASAASVVLQSSTQTM